MRESKDVCRQRKDHMRMNGKTNCPLESYIEQSQKKPILPAL